MFQLTAPENLQPDVISANVFRFAQRLFVHGCARLELVQIIEIHDRVFLLERCVVEPTLRESPNERHLPALEAEPNAAARARFLAFVPLAACFPVTGTLADAEPFDAMPRTGPRLEIVQ